MAKLRLNGLQLKTIALVLMVLDHIHQYIPDLPIVLNWVGRIVAPIFFYLMVEGFRKTRNRRRYIT
ncbi:conjugal transfer protein TraX, partial [Clostridium perfringens]|nr:conjugal transfer protein TraX [Clostridium perfringens]